MNTFEKIEKEINAALAMADDETEQLALNMAESQEALAAAKRRQAAALDAGDRDAFTAAGLAAQKAQLDIEFTEGQMKKSQEKTYASADDDARIRDMIKKSCDDLVHNTMDDFIRQMTDMMDRMQSVSNTIQKMDALEQHWDSYVMKNKPIPKSTMLENDYLIVPQTLNVLNTKITQFNLTKQAKGWSD